jgi:DNA repair protein RecO
VDQGRGAVSTVLSDAVCVRHWDFSETSQTVSLFTRERGMLRGLAKGAKRERGRFSGGIDLLTRGQVVALEKPGRELATLTDWDLQETFRHLREGLEANRAGFYLAELVCRMMVDDAPHPRSYDALVVALRGLADPPSLDRVLLRFQWELLDDAGYRPTLEAPLEGTLAFSPRAGGVVAASEDASAWPVRRETIELLRAVAAPEEHAEEFVSHGDDLESPSRVLPTRERRAARLLAAYLREIIGFEPTTMRAVFGEIAVPRASG